MTYKIQELNLEFVKLVEELKPQPVGTKSQTLHSDKTTGVRGSEKAAQLHSSQLKKHNLKNTLELLGVEYNHAPALLAGIGSRESNLGLSLEPETSEYWGWGDYSQRGGESEKTFHGFGILQLDCDKAPFEEVRRELKVALACKSKLNPYDKRWLEWGLKAFLQKLENARRNFPKLASPEQFATALSHYNGGKGLQYPENDNYTTGKDYANDTLVRARWFAQNWSNII